MHTWGVPIQGLSTCKPTWKGSIMEFVILAGDKISFVMIMTSEIILK